MLRATAVVRRLAVKADKVVDTVVLDHEGRHRRRIALTGEGGTEVLLDLEKPAALQDGDALKLEDGRLVLVKAADQDLVEIRAENPLRLLRVAWHIGNRHTPAEITADAIYIEDDHVLVEMVRGQGCSAAPVKRPFQPERGAYDHAGHGHDHGHGHHGHAHDHGHGHDHDHGHHHDHDHDHGHGHSHAHAHAAQGHAHASAHSHSSSHSHAHDHGHAHDHVHGPDCGHDHDHGHGHGHKHSHKHD
jgi:urease accessory protein